ncbi:MAG TPA: NAD-dependent epimerase/dehydratase family protein [Atribacteraceae bacterium]|nr:NAD-dependent epimerase/dehydratase family protein [Atribacteraceae bacterium]
MATILITGGAGFIGSHVVDLCLREGRRVVVVDNLSSGRQDHVHPGARFYQADITDQAAMEAVFQEEKPDIINHHAAHINLRRSVEDPLTDARQNILGSLVLLELSRHYGVRRFIFASTGGAMYGEPVTLPVEETAEAHPLSPYGVAKRSVELYLDSYRLNWGLEAVILRYGNVYGPRQEAGGEAGVVAIFSKRILFGRPCTIYGDGRQTRDYVFVGDVARANLLALYGPPGTYNIGTGQETSVLDLVEMLGRASSRQVSVVHASSRPGETARIALSAHRSKAVLRWAPATTLPEGIALTWQWFLENDNRHCF